MTRILILGFIAAALLLPAATSAFNGQCGDPFGCGGSQTGGGDDQAVTHTTPNQHLSPFQVAHRAALRRGRQLAHHSVKVGSLMHVYGRRWYAQLTWTSAGAAFDDNCLIELYIFVRGQSATTKTESKSCF